MLIRQVALKERVHFKGKELFFYSALFFVTRSCKWVSECHNYFFLEKRFARCKKKLKNCRCMNNFQITLFGRAIQKLSIHRHFFNFFCICEFFEKSVCCLLSRSSKSTEQEEVFLNTHFGIQKYDVIWRIFVGWLGVCLISTCPQKYKWRIFIARSGYQPGCEIWNLLQKLESKNS